MSAEEKRIDWAAPVRGALVSLGIYLGGAALLAWAAVSGMAEPGGMTLAVLALAASFVGGIAAGRGGRTRGVPLLSSVLFALALAAAGWGVWREWTRGGGVLVLCVLAGGLLASLLRARPRKKRRRRA